MSARRPVRRFRHLSRIAQHLVLPFIITVTHRGRRCARLARRDDRFNYPKMEKIVRLVYLTAHNLATSAARPKFVPQTTPATPTSSR